VKRLHPELGNLALLAGAALIFEWHLVWAAASGMETALAALLTAAVLAALFKAGMPPRAWLTIGLAIGIMVWIRPDGILLLAPAGVALLLEAGKPFKAKLRDGALILTGFALPFGLYLLFNQVTAGSICRTPFTPSKPSTLNCKPSRC